MLDLGISVKRHRLCFIKRKEDNLSKKVIRTALIILVVLLAAACIALSLITLELEVLTEYPTRLRVSAYDEYPGEEHYFLFSVPVRPDADLPFTINGIELRNTDGGSTAASSKIFICEHEDSGIQPGVRYCSIRELQEQFGKMTPAEDSTPYRVGSLPLDIFIMTPGDIAVTQPTYELTVTYSWLGIFRHTATATIK